MVRVGAGVDALSRAGHGARGRAGAHAAAAGEGLRGVAARDAVGLGVEDAEARGGVAALVDGAAVGVGAVCVAHARAAREAAAHGVAGGAAGAEVRAGGADAATPAAHVDGARDAVVALEVASALRGDVGSRRVDGGVAEARRPRRRRRRRRGGTRPPSCEGKLSRREDQRGHQGCTTDDTSAARWRNDRHGRTRSLGAILSEFLFDRATGFALDLSRMDIDPAWRASMDGALRGALEEMRALEAGAVANPDEGRRVGHYWLRDPSRAPDDETRAAEIARRRSPRCARSRGTSTPRGCARPRRRASSPRC